MSEVEQWQLIRGGVLHKRGTHVKDKYYARYVCLWPSKMGYSLSTNTNIMCNFLSMEDIDSASPIPPDDPSFQDEREFIVYVKEQANKIDSGKSDEMLSRRKLENQQHTSKGRRSKRFHPVELIDCHTSSNRQLQVPDDRVWEAASRPQPYFLRASTVSERNSWIHDINTAAERHRAHQARLVFEKRHFALRMQKYVRKAYTSIEFQMFTACLVAVNFFVMMFQAQTSRYTKDIFNGTSQVMQSSGALSDDFLGAVEILFTVFFSVELLVNMIAFWWKTFFSDVWNWFDMFVIGTSIWGLVANGSGVNFLRLFRALRVFKLVRKLQSMRKILISLGACVKPVLSAFFMLFILMSIYAQIGYTFFGSIQPDWFGCYSLAMLTLVQVLTFDGWVDHLARDMLDGYNDPGMQFAVGGFMVSWAFLSGFIMMNIVLAILVESFTAAQDAMRTEQQEMSDRKRIYTPIRDPMEKLIAQWGGITSREKLDTILETIFSTLDLNQSGTLECWEIQRYLWNYFSSRLSDEMFHEITAGRRLCEPDGSLSLDGFKAMAYVLIARHGNESESPGGQIGFGHLFQRFTVVLNALWPSTQSVSDASCTQVDELGDQMLRTEEDENVGPTLRAMQKIVEKIETKLGAVDLMLAKMEDFDARLDCIGEISTRSGTTSKVSVREWSISGCACCCDVHPWPKSVRKSGKSSLFALSDQIDSSQKLQTSKHCACRHNIEPSSGSKLSSSMRIPTHKECATGQINNQADFDNVKLHPNCTESKPEDGSDAKISVPMKEPSDALLGHEVEDSRNDSGVTLAGISEPFKRAIQEEQLVLYDNQNPMLSTPVEFAGAQECGWRYCTDPDASEMSRTVERTHFSQRTGTAGDRKTSAGLKDETTPKRPRSLARTTPKSERAPADEDTVTEEFDLLSEATEHAMAALRPGWAAVRLCEGDRSAYSKVTRRYGEGPPIAKNLPLNSIGELRDAAANATPNNARKGATDHDQREGHNSAEASTVVVAQNAIPIKVLHKHPA